MADFGVHFPNVPTDQFRQDVDGPVGGKADLYWRVGASRAVWVLLLATEHTRQDALDCKRHGLFVMVRAKGEGIVYTGDVLRMIDEFGPRPDENQGRPVADVFIIGNEPDGEDLWRHRWYVEQVRVYCADQVHRAGIKLCTPGWRMGAEPPGPDSREPYNLIYNEYMRPEWDYIGLHAYAPTTMLDGSVVDHIHAWTTAFPDKPDFMKRFLLTEFGIASRALTDTSKGQAYGDFIRFLTVNHPRVRVAVAFILGGTPDFAAFGSGGYDPNGPNSYWLSDAGWQRLGWTLAQTTRG